MKCLFIVLFLSFAFFARAQKGTSAISLSYGDGKVQALAQKRSSLAISYGLGIRIIGSFYKGGGYSTDQKSLNIFGLNYWREIGKNLYFETGIQVIRYDYLNTSLPPNNTTTNEVLNIISVPFNYVLRLEIMYFLMVD